MVPLAIKMRSQPIAININPIAKRMKPRFSCFQRLTLWSFFPSAAIKRMTINGETKRMLYQIKRRNALKSKYWLNMVMMARYGAPVHGNSIAETNAPRRAMLVTVIFAEEYL